MKETNATETERSVACWLKQPGSWAQGSRLKPSSRLDSERELPNSGRPRASLPRPAPACARASIQAAAAAGLGRAAAAQAHTQDLQDARERIRGKTEKSVATYVQST